MRGCGQRVANQLSIQPALCLRTNNDLFGSKQFVMIVNDNFQSSETRIRPAWREKHGAYDYAVLAYTLVGVTIQSEARVVNDLMIHKIFTLSG